MRLRSESIFSIVTCGQKSTSILVFVFCSLCHVSILLLVGRSKCVSAAISLSLTISYLHIIQLDGSIQLKQKLNATSESVKAIEVEKIILVKVCDHEIRRCYLLIEH